MSRNNRRKKKKHGPTWLEIYTKHLRSPAWKRFRRLILARSNGNCEQCGLTAKPLCVHHRTYLRLGAELPEDVVALCKGCHDLAHLRIKGTAHKRLNAPPLVRFTKERRAELEARAVAAAMGQPTTATAKPQITRRAAP